jgi:hypothetical protein
MGICWLRPSHVQTVHGVEVSDAYTGSSGQSVVRRTFRTPLGSVYLEEKREPGTGEWHAQRSWRDITPWQLRRMIRNPEDYPVVKYMVENTEYTADYFPIQQAEEWLGEDGIVLAALPHSPMQTLMIDWVGSEEGRFYFHLADYPEMVKELYEALCISRRPLYEIAAKSPAPVILCGDNLDGFLVSPDLFHNFFLPVYQEQAAMLHEHGKLMAVHMDGRLGALKDGIARTAIDIIEAFHPPPMGDISVGEALSAWPDKSIWIGFPDAIYLHGPKETSRFARELMRDIGSGDRLIIEMSTESLVSNENLRSLTSVLEKAKLPLTEHR